MSLVDFVFGRRRAEPPARLEIVEHAPPGAWWREVRPRAGAEPVRAAKADRGGQLHTSRGAQHYRAGDYIVDHGGGDEAVVRAEIFERTYRPTTDGRFRKRTDIVLRYFTLKRPVLVRSLEGLERAEAGDWIMEGLEGELWPVAADKAQVKYAPL